MTESVDFSKNPPDYEVLCQYILELKKCQSLKIFSIGRSVLGRNVYAIGIGKLCYGTLYVGGVHGLEWLTTLLLLKFAKEITERKDVLSCLETKGVIIVPCLNPDGVDIAINGTKNTKEYSDFVMRISGGDFSKWQANVNGVDLNHNFDAGYEKIKRLERKAGIVGPAPTRYGGEYAFSEPETKALSLICRLFEIQTAFAFHSQGEEIYYQYGENTPVRSRLMAELLSQTSGYKLVTQHGLASHGGFKDWFIEHLHRPAFTIEIGKGKNPLPIEDFPKIYEKLEDTLYLGLTL